MSRSRRKRFFREVEPALCAMLKSNDMKYYATVVNTFKKYRPYLNKDVLLRSEESWNLLIKMYNESMPEISFLDYFWSWRNLFGSLFSVLLGPLPEAKCYHSLCTGYAGIYMSRAFIETGRPAIVTEHGLYTNERRIEIASADWLVDQKKFTMSVVRNKFNQELRDFRGDMFTNYSHFTYQAASKIITLFGGNRLIQIEEGADEEKTLVIPNGIDYDRFSAVEHDEDHPFTVALIGRVVPIKDVKTYIRSIGIALKRLPSLKAFIIGGTDEDPEYHQECLELVKHEGLEDNIEFTGKVIIDEYLKRIDIVILTSLSESQPLVILEAGAAGIPSIATNVGACYEMIYGSEIETEAIGRGGVVVPLSNPFKIGEAICEMLLNRETYYEMAKAAKKRTFLYYNMKDQIKSYRKLYDTYAVD
jgi:glycosyltransferase involved in cell wall biosynthesis